MRRGVCAVYEAVYGKECDGEQEVGGAVPARACLACGVGGRARGEHGASAQGLSMAFTVLVQESITQVSPNVYEYKTTTLRVTQKDVLARLAAYCSFSAGSILDCNGDFEILGPTGALLHTVNTSYLDAVGHTSVLRGRADGNPGGRVNVKYSTPAEFDIHIGAMLFDLRGAFFETLAHNAVGTTNSFSYTLQGGGTLDGKDAFATGKMKFKVLIL